MKLLMIAILASTLLVNRTHADPTGEKKGDLIHRFRQHSLEECSFLLNTRLELLEKSADLSNERKEATRASMYERFFLTWLQLRALDVKFGEEPPYDYACKRLKQSILKNLRDLKLTAKQLDNPMNDKNLDKEDQQEWKPTLPDRIFAFYPPRDITNVGDYKKMIKEFREWCEK